MNRRLLLALIGFFLTVLGLVLVLSINNIFTYILKQVIPLSPGSTTYEIWKKPPVPVRMSVYFFNCTNTEQWKEKNFKPNLEELGPYTFSEYHEKVNITWNSNHTVTYRQIRRWYFDAENSNGTLKDQITTINMAVLGAAYVTRYWSKFTIYALSTAIQIMHKSIWMTPTVEDFLFNGHTDPIITLADKLPGFSQYVRNFGRSMAVFPHKNGSHIPDGVFNMDTGAENISRFGSLRYWNYRNHSGIYESNCGEIRGSASGLFPSGLSKGESVELFHPDLCRYLIFDYVKETEVNGVPGNYYVISKKILDNGTTYPDSECVCAGQCLRQGVMNATECRKGPPLFISAPHFLYADSYYWHQVNGLNPDPSRHTTYIVMEPITGVPLTGSLRAQFNLLLQPFPGITMYKDVPTIMFPALWLEEHATLPSDLLFALGMLLKLPVVGLYCGIGLLTLGLILLAGTIFHHITQRKLKRDISHSRRRKVKNPDDQNKTNRPTSEMVGFLPNEATDGKARR